MTPNLSRATQQAGFSLIEVLITLTLFLVISGTVLKGMMDMTRVNDVVVNRTDMHNGVRNATELLTQEIGQAGRVSLPTNVTLTVATAVGATAVTVDNTAGMFPGELLIMGSGTNEETTTIAAVNSATTLTVAALDYTHPVGAAVRAAGGFAAGVIPSNVVNGSTGSVLKIFGDVNGDGNMVYVEYVCNIDVATNVGRLYRNSMPFTAGAKLAPTVEQILIDNIQRNPVNPDGTVTPCFTYQQQTVGGNTYVLDVAITLTVRSQKIDPITRRQQTETKALLNVSPRNVFNVWQLASLNITNRIQPMPATVQNLLPCVQPCQ